MEDEKTPVKKKAVKKKELAQELNYVLKSRMKRRKK